MTILKTKRLILRPWREEDLESFAKLNADPRVMECLMGPLSQHESNKLATLIQNKMKEKGWGFWAVEVPGVADFIGFIGLAPVLFSAPFTPAVEIVCAWLIIIGVLGMPLRELKQLWILDSR